MRYLDNFLGTGSLGQLCGYVGTGSLGSASIPHRDRIRMLIGSTWQNITDKDILSMRVCLCCTDEFYVRTRAHTHTHQLGVSKVYRSWS